jgi:deoxycytidylate deaminase
MTSICGDKISAVDLSKVVMVNSYREDNKKNVLTNEDLAFQEARKQRKVRKLDFEVR